MEYQATYRRGEVAIPALLGVLLLMVGGIAFSIKMAGGEAMLSAILWVLGLSVLAVAVIFASVFRTHRWTIAADGMHILERPKVPLMGLPRRVELPWDQIAALRRVESGLNYQIELSARGGRRFRLSQAMKAGAGTDPDPTLDDFLAAILSAAREAGASLQEPTEGLSFWNTLPGLAVQLVMLALALLFAGAAGLMLIEGEVPSRPRVGYGAGIALLLPFGAGWLLVKSLRRRRRVLAQHGGGRSGG